MGGAAPSSLVNDGPGTGSWRRPSCFSGTEGTVECRFRSDHKPKGSRLCNGVSKKSALEKTSMDRFYRKNRDPVLRSKSDRD